MILDYSTEWQTVAGDFSLSTSGDTVLLYCFTSNNELTHISGFSNRGDWQPPGLDEAAYGSRTSALPAGLGSIGSVALAHADNYKYNGTKSGTKEEIQTSLTKSEFWTGSNTEHFDPPTVPFIVISQSPVDGSCGGWSAGDVMVCALNSDNPDAVALVALSDLKEGTDLYMTDNAWTGASFRSNEGTVKVSFVFFAQPGERWYY